MHHKIAFLVLAVTGVLAELFLDMYEPSPKLSTGQKVAFRFLFACAFVWIGVLS